MLACCPPAPAANLFRLLPGDYEAAQARVDLIEQATEELDVVYYWIGNDRLAALFLGLLRDAALRGVRVRLVVDAAHNDIPSEVQAVLLRAGVRIKEFHPATVAHPQWFNRRMHDKLLIADGRLLIAGSRNLRSVHFGMEKINFVDRDAWLAGDVVDQARRYYDCLWNCGEVRDTELADRPWQEWKQKDRLALEQMGVCGACGCLGSDCLAALWLGAGNETTICCQPILHQTGTDWSAGAIEFRSACFVYDPAGRKGHPLGIGRQLLTLIHGARRSIVLETPYFLMSRELRRALYDARARGVRVRLLTNSLDSNNHLFLAAGQANQKPGMLHHGFELWQLAGPHHLHAKSAVFDDCTAFVGTFNFDPRSEFLNTENGVVVHDAAVAAWVTASIEEHMGRAYRIGFDGRSVAQGTRQPGAAPRKVLVLQPARLAAPLLRRSL